MIGRFIDWCLEPYFPNHYEEIDVSIAPYADIPPKELQKSCEEKYSIKREEAKRRLGGKYILAAENGPVSSAIGADFSWVEEKLEALTIRPSSESFYRALTKEAHNATPTKSD